MSKTPGRAAGYPSGRSSPTSPAGASASAGTFSGTERLSCAQLHDLQARGGGVARMQARGRLPPGQMNKTEARYAAHLEQMKRAGEVLWWCFEGITLKLAHDTRLTVDFAVMTAAGLIELHDIKGARAIVQDDAKVKMKVAAAGFPFVFRMVLPRKGGGWESIEIGPKAVAA